MALAGCLPSCGQQRRSNARDERRRITCTAASDQTDTFTAPPAAITIWNLSMSSMSSCLNPGMKPYRSPGDVCFCSPTAVHILQRALERLHLLLYCTAVRLGKDTWIGHHTSLLKNSTEFERCACSGRWLRRHSKSLHLVTLTAGADLDISACTCRLQVHLLSVLEHHHAGDSRLRRLHRRKRPGNGERWHAA